MIMVISLIDQKNKTEISDFEIVEVSRIHIWDPKYLYQMLQPLCMFIKSIV